MSEYDLVRKGKIVLKGEDKKNKRKRKHKNKDVKKTTEPITDEDKISHGGWANVTNVVDMRGSVAIEFGKQTYVTALDNGLFTLGAPHDEGEGPSPEEVLTAITVNDTKVAFKSGYGKYLGVNKEGCVIGRSDAIGGMEQWEPVYQDGKLALLSYTSCFMSVRQDDDTVVAVNRTAGPGEFLHVRSAAIIEKNDDADIPTEEKGNLTQIEENYVRKFQKFQDKKVRINSGDLSELKKAKTTGTLHETLLDRRSKMKADRYCK